MQFTSTLNRQRVRLGALTALVIGLAVAIWAIWAPTDPGAATEPAPRPAAASVRAPSHIDPLVLRFGRTETTHVDPLVLRFGRTETTHVDPLVLRFGATTTTVATR